MEQTSLAYGLPKETVTAIMMCSTETRKSKFANRMEARISSTLFAGILQGDTLAPYLFIICLDILRMSIVLLKENGFALKRQEADDIPQKL